MRRQSPGVSWASADPLAAGVGALRLLRLLPAHGQSPLPAAEPRDAQASFKLGGEGTVPDTVGYRVLGTPTLILAC